MKEFELVVYEKIKIWEKSQVVVEAETLEEAIEKCKNGDYDDIWDSDVCYDTREYLEPSNEDPLTMEIYEWPETLGQEPIYKEIVKD